MFGEQRMLADLQAHSPDFILLVHKDTSEYGHRFFGQNYARKLSDWIGSNYDAVSVAGSLPFQGDAFGILLLKKR